MDSTNKQFIYLLLTKSDMCIISEDETKLEELSIKKTVLGKNGKSQEIGHFSPNNANTAPFDSDSEKEETPFSAPATTYKNKEQSKIILIFFYTEVAKKVYDTQLTRPLFLSKVKDFVEETGTVWTKQIICGDEIVRHIKFDNPGSSLGHMSVAQITKTIFPVEIYGEGKLYEKREDKYFFNNTTFNNLLKRVTQGSDQIIMSHGKMRPQEIYNYPYPLDRPFGVVLSVIIRGCMSFPIIRSIIENSYELYPDCFDVEGKKVKNEQSHKFFCSQIKEKTDSYCKKLKNIESISNSQFTLNDNLKKLLIDELIRPLELGTIPSEINVRRIQNESDLSAFETKLLSKIKGENNKDFYGHYEIYTRVQFEKLLKDIAFFFRNMVPVVTEPKIISLKDNFVLHTRATLSYGVKPISIAYINLLLKETSGIKSKNFRKKDLKSSIDLDGISSAAASNQSQATNVVANITPNSLSTGVTTSNSGNDFTINMLKSNSQPTPPAVSANPVLKSSSFADCDNSGLNNAAQLSSQNFRNSTSNDGHSSEEFQNLLKNDTKSTGNISNNSDSNSISGNLNDNKFSDGTAMAIFGISGNAKLQLIKQPSFSVSTCNINPISAPNKLITNNNNITNQKFNGMYQFQGGNNMGNMVVINNNGNNQAQQDQVLSSRVQTQYLNTYPSFTSNNGNSHTVSSAIEQSSSVFSIGNNTVNICLEDDLGSRQQSSSSQLFYQGNLNSFQMPSTTINNNDMSQPPPAFNQITPQKFFMPQNNQSGDKLIRSVPIDVNNSNNNNNKYNNLGQQNKRDHGYIFQNSSERIATNTNILGTPSAQTFPQTATAVQQVFSNNTQLQNQEYPMQLSQYFSMSLNGGDSLQSKLNPSVKKFKEPIGPSNSEIAKQRDINNEYGQKLNQSAAFNNISNNIGSNSQFFNYIGSDYNCVYPNSLTQLNQSSTVKYNNNQNEFQPNSLDLANGSFSGINNNSNNIFQNRQNINSSSLISLTKLNTASLQDQPSQINGLNPFSNINNSSSPSNNSNNNNITIGQHYVPFYARPHSNSNVPNSIINLNNSNNGQNCLNEPNTNEMGRNYFITSTTNAVSLNYKNATRNSEQQLSDYIGNNNSNNVCAKFFIAQPSNYNNNSNNNNNDNNNNKTK